MFSMLGQDLQYRIFHDSFFFIELDMTVKEVTLNDDSGLESTISEEKSFEGQIVEKKYTFEKTCFQDI